MQVGIVHNRWTSLLCAYAVVTSLAAVAATPARADHVDQPKVVSAIPAPDTPDVDDGVVDAIGQVGSTVFLGGSFTTVSPHQSDQTYATPFITAFDAATGAIRTGFAPVIDGDVQTIVPGPTPGTVYVGGAFSHVDGVATRIALLDTNSGAIAAGWQAPDLNGAVNALAVADGQLFVGGEFTRVGADVHDGLVALDPTTGQETGYLTPNFTRHHNYRVQCFPDPQTVCANGAVGVRSLDVNPSGNTLVAVGNFRLVGGAPRDQVAMLSLSGSAATVTASWATLAYTSSCRASHWDSPVRQVQFAPDGSYFVIVATGGGGKNADGTRSPCDAAARFETAAQGSDVHPTWVDFTGEDSLYSVAVAGSAIYVGGHERWLNNSKGGNVAGQGAVPRPGISAIDPVNGLPLSWNPGRDPRGAGAYALLATSAGLYVGSDTDWIGNRAFHHDKIAFFPLAGGQALAPTATGTLPGDIYLVGGPSAPDGVRMVHWDGTTPPSTPVTLAGTDDFSQARGVFEIDNTVYYGDTDGHLYQRRFDGTTFGPAAVVDPYDDPVWSGIQTGAGQTYQGLPPTLYAKLGQLSSMFYDDGRIYYTFTGDRRLYSRSFEHDDGVIGADESSQRDSVDWSDVAGAFLVGDTLYYADGETGVLHSVSFVDGQPAGSPTVADDTIDWASAGTFVQSNAVSNNHPPGTVFTSSCDDTTLTCDVDGSASRDPDGTITTYEWKWGDGTTTPDASPTQEHTFDAIGRYPVTLKVTDNDGLTSSATEVLQVGQPPPPPALAFNGAATTTGTTRHDRVTVPPSAATGDLLLLYVAAASGHEQVSAPAGWALVGKSQKHGLRTAVFDKLAADSDAGATVKVKLSKAAATAVTMADYADADPTDPIEASARATASGERVTAPGLSGLSAGSMVVSFWADLGGRGRRLHAFSTVVARATSHGADRHAVNTLLADSGTAVTGDYPSRAAATHKHSDSLAGWTVALRVAPS
jgi:hypothetical protein